MEGGLAGPRDPRVRIDDPAAAAAWGEELAIAERHRELFTPGLPGMWLVRDLEVIRARLAEGWTAAELELALEGGRVSPHNAAPGRQTIRALLGDASRVVALAALAPAARRRGGQDGRSGGPGGGTRTGPLKTRPGPHDGPAIPLSEAREFLRAAAAAVTE